MIKSSFVDYVVNDLLSDFKGVRAKKMFGGHGVFKDDLMFAIIVDDELYYKVDESNRRDFEKVGSEPFRYDAKGRGKVSLSYWKLPTEALDDLQVLGEWTEKAMRAALNRSKTQKSRKQSKP